MLKSTAPKRHAGNSEVCSMCTQAVLSPVVVWLLTTYKSFADINLKTDSTVESGHPPGRRNRRPENRNANVDASPLLVAVFRNAWLIEKLDAGGWPQVRIFPR